MWAFLGRVVYRLFGRIIWRLELHGTDRARVIVIGGARLLLVKSLVGEQRWELPGGGVLKQEDIADAALREVKEETGLQINKAELREVGTSRIEQNGAVFISHFLSYALAAPLPIKKEWPWVLSAEWFALGELPENINPPDLEAINKYLTR